MKTLFVLLVLGVIAAAFGWQHYQHNQTPTLSQRAAALAERTRAAADEAKGVVSAKTREWNLTPDHIKDELAKTGQIVRSRAIVVGEKMDDARIIAVIKGKYVVERNLSSFDISVDCHEGTVKLAGWVNSPAQIGRAVELALQTNGVHHVVSDLSLKT
ncbi:MAG TPA: BON domain-containing protein [Lacunisphaera sp.]|jgi:osmotically-inducible protein OsmY